MAQVLTADQLNTIAKSSGYTGGSFSSVGLPSTLNSTNVTSSGPINLPPPPVSTTNYTGMTAGGNAIIGANNTAITPSGATVDIQTGAVVKPPEDTAASSFQTFKDYIANMVKPPSAGDLYNTDYASSGIDQKQADFQAKQQALLDAQSKFKGLDAKLQGLNAEAQAIPIQAQQDATGRGITAGGLAPLTADKLRENALKAIPIQTEALVAQAEVASAQGNAQLSQSILEQAQEHLDKVFQIHMQDAKNQYEYQNTILDKVYEFATKQEQKRIDERKEILSNNNSQYNLFTNDVRNMANVATANGQGSLATKFSQLVTNLNPNSPTFTQDYQKALNDFATLQGQVNIAQKVIGGSTSSSGKSTGGTTTSVNTNKYNSDLDAIIGSTLSTIPTKFGQETFQSQINKARNDSDKINLIASQILKGQPAEFKTDFANQAVGISMLDKAIAELDSGVQTGKLNSTKQYLYNLTGRDFDPALTRIQGYITSAIQPYRNSVTGAAWGDQEEAEYTNLFGSTKYSPSELRARLVQTKELLKSKSAEGLNSFVNPLGYYDNQFSSGNLTPTTQATSQTTTPATSGTTSFWSKVGNFLFGSD